MSKNVGETRNRYQLRSETAQKGSILQEAWSSAEYIENSSGQNEKKSSNKTEEEWLHMLCVNGNKISHDAGIKEDFKVEVDEKLSLEGKQFFQDNFFMTLVNMFLGLYSILYIPNIARILNITGKSGSTALSFQRYLSTLTHAIQWFQSSEDMKLSLKQVLTLHRAGSFRGQKEELDNTGQREISKGITQFDMVITQWGFIGPALVFNHRIPFYSQGDSEEGFIYIMYMVGKSLGILDQYNLCSGTVQQTKQRCNLILRQVLQPCLENRTDLSEQMTFHLLNGINVLNPLIVEQDFKLMSEKLLLEKELSDENGSTVYQLYLFFFQKVLYMPGSWIIRKFTNGLLKYNIWLAGKWSSYIFQNLNANEQLQHSIIDRLGQIFNIPIFSAISVSGYVFQKFRDAVRKCLVL